MRMSGSRWAATAKANFTYMPEEYRFTGVSTNWEISEKSTISSSFRVISPRVMPRIAPLR